MSRPGPLARASLLSCLVALACRDEGGSAGSVGMEGSETRASGSESGSGEGGDGDGEGGDGDGEGGDGDGALGDGDGEGGDGDGELGDGDGEVGDGDGEVGDGDGDGEVGDGDGDPPAPDPVPLVFSAMGDVPYSPSDYELLPMQILQHNALSPSRFMVHLGDIKSGASPCVEQVYADVAAILAQLELPTFVLVGDNEWNDCQDPAQAWGLWQSYLGNFHAQWEAAPELSVQPGRPENLAWIEEGVLLVSLTLPGGATHDPGEWDALLADAAAWIEEQLFGAPPEVYAAVVFGHANPAAKHQPFMLPFRAAASDFARPVLYLHGDGHVWIEDQPWPEPNMFRVQVDQGGSADPLQVTVDPEAPGINPFVFERDPF